MKIVVKLMHPNILRTFELLEDPIRFFVVTEYCSGGDMFDELTKMKTFNERRVAITIK